MNLYQHATNQAFSSFFSGNIVDLKILQSDWPRAFWHIIQELKIFPNMRSAQAININFH